MNLRVFFLGRERAISVGGKKLKARQWPGSDIFVAEDGSFLLPRWRGVEEGETPYQRRQKKWSSKELTYIAYPQGLLSALRSRQLALFQARILGPTYEQAMEVFKQEVRGVIIVEETMDPREISSELLHKLRQFGFVFLRARKPGVKEAMVKILFLFQDRATGLNVGAMLARTVAVTDRLRERLLGMYAWVREYSAQEKILYTLRAEVLEVIRQAEVQMSSLCRNPAIVRGGGSKKTQRLVIDRLTTLSMRIEPLRFIQPFSYWMAFVMEDFDELLQALETQDFVLARALIERILFSISLKNIQGSFDRLLLRIGQDAIIKRLSWNNYASWTASLAARMKSLVSEERRVNLRKKVCWEIGEALEEASQEASTRRRLVTFKTAVKRAYALL